MAIAAATNVVLSYGVSEPCGEQLIRPPEHGGDLEQQTAQFLVGIVQHGQCVQARSANLLTCRLYISLECMRNAPAVAFDTRVRPLTLPTVSGGFDHMQEQIASIVAKVEKMSLNFIGRYLDASLANLSETLWQVNG